MLDTTIGFNEIPYSKLEPGTYYEIRPDYSKAGTLVFPARVLIISQMLATGSAVPNTIYPITRLNQAPALFGRGSIAAQQIAAFLRANPYLPLFAMGVSDLVAGVVATQLASATASSTSAGTGTVLIGDDSVSFGIASGDSVTVQAAAAAAAINANPDLPVTATSAVGVVTATFKHKGECGNALKIAVTSTATGTTWAVTAGVSGSGNPTVITPISTIAGQWYTDIAFPWTDSVSIAAFEADGIARFLALGKLDTHYYVGLNASYATAATYSAARNCKHVSSIPANGSQTPPWVWSASLAGVCSFQLANDPARQLRGLSLPGVKAPPEATRFVASERELLLAGGHTTWTANIDGTVSLSRVVTNCTVSPDLGVPTGAWRDIMTVKTLSRVRWDWGMFCALNWPRNKLADDDSIAAQFDPKVCTPRRLGASWGGRYRLYERRGWLENGRQNIDNSAFSRDVSDFNRVNARQPLTVIGNEMVLAGALEFEAAS